MKTPKSFTVPNSIKVAKYSVGDKVKIINQQTHHKNKISIIEGVSKHEGYVCYALKNIMGWYMESELELVKS